MTNKSRNIVILSVSAGTGHMRASAALRTAFIEDDPNCVVTILDTFKYTSPVLEKLILGAYMEMLRVTPGFYGYIYSRSEKGQPLSGFAKTEFNRLLSKFSSGRLIRFITECNPEAVICTHPFPLGVMSSLRRQGIFNIFFAGAITDFTIHPYWVFPEVDLYLVGAGELVENLCGFGIPTEKVHATGIPIDPVFSDRTDGRSVLDRYNLEHSLCTILIMGGGLGMGPLAESVNRLGSLKEPCQLIVVTGNNAQLREKVERAAPALANRVCALGYVNNVHQLMAASDIMVSKAGGLSCAEALASGLPLFILDPLPGQEERNSQFLTSIGAAAPVSGVQDLEEKVSLFLSQPHRLKEMSRAAAGAGRPDAARSSVKAINGMMKNTSY